MTGLNAEHVTASHGRGPEVLQDATVHIPQGSRVALLGANGAGKSTLLTTLAGGHRPSAGQVNVDGVALTHDRRGLRAHRRVVQLVLQDPDDQLFGADVYRDVSFGPANLDLPEDEVRTRVDEALGLLDITHLADRPTHHLSYGERKRVTIAGAVAMRPAYLLLDEPTAGLDPRGQEQTLAAVARLHAGGTTVLLATHDVDLAWAWADSVAVLVDGAVRQGSPAVLLADPPLLEAAGLRPPWPVLLAQRLGWDRAPATLDGLVDRLIGERA